MTGSPPPDAQKRLEAEQNIWLSSVRPNGRPHLVPVWFVWRGGRLYLCIEPDSVKARSIRWNPRVALALEDGSNALICEGKAAPLPAPWPEAVVAAFQQKYSWEISTETQYTQLIEVTPAKWLTW
jgi:PPOX class probable F420-dependent enzyme